jgi:hypothetical protein
MPPDSKAAAPLVKASHLTPDSQKLLNLRCSSILQGELALILGKISDIRREKSKFTQMELKLS